MYQRPAHTPAPRRGVILLVVIALLTLFAVVGISFVLYAQSRADIARIFRDSQQMIIGQGPADPGQVLLAEFLRQFIFDVADPLQDPNTGQTNLPSANNSALRGHSLARTIYGYNYTNPTTVTNTTNPTPINSNTPFNGIGRTRSTGAAPLNKWYPNPPNALQIDEYDLVNYMWFGDSAGINIPDGIHDPERQGTAWRTGLSASLLGNFVGGFNPSYTYPDLNTMYLAAVKADGTVLMPSYHRPWIARKYFGQDFTLAPQSPNDLSLWNGTAFVPPGGGTPPPTNTWLKYLTLRPRPADNISPSGKMNFPAPFNGGDVKNLQGSPGGNDSIWLDLGYPVQTLADGRQYKPLFAPLIIDLDSRVNLNIHGNIRGVTTVNGSQTNDHASNQGWGPWEVNLKWVLNYQSTNSGYQNVGQTLAGPLDPTNRANAYEWQNIFLNSSITTPPASTMLGSPSYGAFGRYGLGLPVLRPYVNADATYNNIAAEFGTWNEVHQAVTTRRYNTNPPFYSLIDYDGCDESTTGSFKPTSSVSPPTPPTTTLIPSITNTVLSPFPVFPTTGYGNGLVNTDNTALPGANPNNELYIHPLLFSFYQPVNSFYQPATQSSYFNSPSGYNTSSPLSAPLPTLADQDMFALLYDLSDSTTLKNSSTTGYLCPLNFTDSTPNITLAGGLPLYLGNSTLGVRRRMLVTTRSFDVDQPSFTPWVWDRTLAGTAYTLQTGGLYPTGPTGTPAISFPSSLGSGTPPAGSEFFSNDWRGDESLTSPYSSVTLADGRSLSTITPGRLDLDRPQYYFDPSNPNPPYPGNHPFLAAYPQPNSDSTKGTVGMFLDTSSTSTFAKAQADRQQLAADLFARLMKVTGAPDLTTTITNNPNTPQYYALQWLAQLAVNIVDYTDSDDIMTPFNWDTVNGGWVFGTELPRLLINEVYAEVINNPSDTGTNASMPYNVNFSIELHNPFQTTDSYSAVLDKGGARLVQDPSTPSSTAIYQIMIAKSVQQIRNASNVLGTPDADPPAPNPPNTVITIGGVKAPFNNISTQNTGALVGTLITGDFTGTPGIAGTDPKTLTIAQPQPANSYGAYSATAGSNSGFFVLGPSSVAAAGQLTPPTPTLQLSALTYTMTATDLTANAMPTHTVLLRRLACPWLPYNNTPGAGYNPYITVDYMENVQVNNGVVRFPVGAANGPNPLAIASRYSWGRTQPYANPAPSSSATNTYQIQKQNPTTPATSGAGLTTFFRHNGVDSALPLSVTSGQLNVPFFWPVHLDRQLVSPMELLEVSGFKPHEFTHQFVDSNGVPYSHRAPWFDNYARIYRIFEFLETWNRQLTMQPAGTGSKPLPINRLPGKININTVWDPEVFLALCDPQNGNSNSFVAVPNPATALNTQTTQSATLFNPMYSANNAQPTDPATVYEQFISSRSPTIQQWPSTSGFYSHFPGPADQPFMGLSFGTYPTADTQFPNPSGMTGVNATLLRPLAVSKDPVTITTPGTPVTFGDGTGSNPPPLNLMSVNSALATANGTMPVTVAVDSGANEEFITIAAGSITGGSSPTIKNIKFYKSHPAGFGIGRVLAPIMAGGTQPSMTSTAAPYTMTPPYLQHQLLNKIFNNVTTRSNVFAIWLTVGFFHVVDDTTNPPKLGREIGTEQGLNVGYRHHMFAIVDRTALCVQDTSSNGLSTTTSTSIPQGGLYTVTTAATLQPQVQPGSLIMLEPNSSNQEVVMVLAMPGSKSLVFRCNKAHASGVTLATTIPGNPGPQALLDLNSNKELIPYWTVLD